MFLRPSSRGACPRATRINCQQNLGAEIPNRLCDEMALSSSLAPHPHILTTSSNRSCRVLSSTHTRHRNSNHRVRHPVSSVERERTVVKLCHTFTLSSRGHVHRKEQNQRRKGTTLFSGIISTLPNLPSTQRVFCSSPPHHRAKLLEH